MEDLYVTGEFDIYMAESANDLQNIKHCEYLGKLNGREWANIFYDTLGCPTFFEIAQNDSPEQQHIEYRLKFKEALSDFQMLQRIDNIYGKVLFDAKQVQTFKEEITRKLSAAKNNKHAYSGLVKLNNACNAAIEKRYCLLLRG